MSLRTRDSKTFRNLDGTLSLMLGRYFHYRDAASDAWQDVDLNLHREGNDHVMDRHDLRVRVTPAGLRVWEHKSGKGIFWPTDDAPTVRGREATFAGPLGLTWTYATRKSGIKLAATVSAPLGQRTLSFPFKLLGGAAPMAAKDGALVSDAFTVDPAIALGADGEIYPLGAWRIDPNSVASFDLDDSQLPARAFPYELDPTTTFKVAASANDDTVRRHGTSWVPPCDYTYPTSSLINVSRAYDPAYGTYDIHNAFMRWNTASIPDDATLLSATVRVRVTYVRNANARKVTADWYSAGWPPVTCTDSATTAQTSASSGMSIGGNGDHDFALGNVNGVSKTGETGLRFHINGGTPTGINRVHWASYDHTSYHEPYLLVKYNRAPYAPDTLSPASGTFASTPQLSARFTDPDGDSGTVFFQVKNSGGAVVASGYNNGPGGKVCNGCSATFTPPSLSDGSYTWQAYGNDGTFTGPWSAIGGFTVASPLTVSKTITPVKPTYFRGEAVTFVLTVSNTQATAVLVDSVSDAFPDTLVTAGSTFETFTSAAPTPTACSATTTPSCALSGNNFSASSFTLEGGASRSFNINTVVKGIDRACSTVLNTASAVSAAATKTGVISLLTCDSGLGLENWWSYISGSAGPQAAASVNVANGNLVLAQTDSTPVQTHGHLAHVIRRTYNSQDTGLATLPGSFGAGWTLNVTEADDVGGAVSAAGLYVPTLHSVTQPLGVTLVDRDGTRHVFTPKGLSGAPIDVTSITSGPLLALVPKVLPSTGRVCVDQTYQGPAGVHLSLWRYVQITTSGSCANIGASSPVVLGFAAMRPDRLRYEFSATGKLLSLIDSNGVELRYRYEQAPAAGVEVGRLLDVWEPRSCTRVPVGTGPGEIETDTEVTLNCRMMRFSYPSSTETRVTDPGGRVTNYFFDTATPARLIRVHNDDGTEINYTYGPGNCAGAGANQLCSVSDPRGAVSTFTYEAAPHGPARIASVTDRRGTNSDFTYSTSPDSLTVDTAGQRRQFLSIDTTGRVGEILEGALTGDPLRRTLYTWDATGSTCRQPDNAVDNNLCRLVRDAGTSPTPDEDTALLYNAEGGVLRERRVNSGTNLDTTYGYRVQYVQAGGVAATADDLVIGSGNVTSASRSTAIALFYLSDRTQMLTPRGNGAGAGYATYLTTYRPDNNNAVSANVVPEAGSCADPAAPTSNTGNLCEVVGPKLNGSTGVTTNITRFAYDSFGQKTKMVTPKAIAEGRPESYIYTYYEDSDSSIALGVSAGGWLKAITDPAGNFAAFAYDSAGNVVRTWDRNATAGLALTAFPGTQAAPPSNAYTETLYGTGLTAYSRPWRYVRSQRDQLGDATTFTADENGNATRIRPPRGNQAASASYDITQTFDAGDLLLTTHMPAAPAGKDTEYGHDNLGNLTSITDPLGNVTVSTYDEVNRQTGRIWTRGPWTGDGTQPTACRQSTEDDDPIPPGRILCQETTAHDGVDNITGISDGNAQTTTLAYDGVHRETRRLVPRNDGTLTTLRTDRVYDADGNLIRVCPPREFTEGPGSCAFLNDFVTDMTYDPTGRLWYVTRYRNASPRQALRTAFNYDSDGNVTLRQDQQFTTWTYDLLGRAQTMVVPRDTTTSLTTSWRYDPSGNVTAVTRPGTSSTPGITGGGRITAYSYDAANQLRDTVVGSNDVNAATAGTPGADGGTNTRTRRYYDADGNTVAVLGPRAFTASVASPDPSFMVRTEFDVDGRPVAQYVPRYGMDPTTSDTGLSNTQPNQCTTGNRPANVSGVPDYPSGVGVCVSRQAYDVAGRTSRLTLPTSSGTDNRYLTYAYTDDGFVDKISAPSPISDGSRVDAQRYLYDAVGRPVKDTDALGHSQTSAYFADGLLQQQTGQPNGTITHTTTHGYNANGDRTSTTTPVGDVKRWVYFSDGLVKDVIDGLGNTTRYGYDQSGNPTEVSAPAAVAGAAPNPSGTPTKNTFTYDNLLATSTVPVAGDGSTRRRITYGYDFGGRKTSQRFDEVNASGVVTSSGRLQQFTYYPNDLLQTERGVDSLRIVTKTHTYDPSGNLARITQAGAVGGDTVPSTISATYYLDDLLRTVDAGESLGGNFYSYDGAGRRAARADQPTLCADCPKTTTRYTYSDAGLPASLTSDLVTGSVTWSYDAAGRPNTQTSPNSQTRTFSFNDDDTLASLAVSSSPNGTVTFGYTYDKNYRIKTQSYAGPGAGPGAGTTPDRTTYSYSYDAGERLSSFTDSTGTYATNPDRNGNRTTWGSSRSFTYNADDSIKTETSDGTTLLYDYDQNGRLKTNICRTYSYDPFDRMTIAAPGGVCSGQQETYGYDALDRQHSHPNQGNGFDRFDGLSQVIAVGGNGSSYVLGPEAEPLALKNGSTVQFLSDDGQGNVSLIENTSGGLECTARFTAFGDAEAITTPEKNCDTGSSPYNELFYRAARHDSETGTYLFGSRIYDPDRASYLTADTYRASTPAADLSLAVDPLTRNTYSYVNGDPVNLVDPTGHRIPDEDKKEMRREQRQQWAGDCAHEFATGGDMPATRDPRTLYIEGNLEGARPGSGHIPAGCQAFFPERPLPWYTGVIDFVGDVTLFNSLFDAAVYGDYKGLLFDAALTVGTLGAARVVAPVVKPAIKGAGRLLSGLGRGGKVLTPARRAISGGATSNLVDDLSRVADDLVDDAARGAPQTTLYRAVSSAERADIGAFRGFRAGPNSYEGKLFAATAEDAARYGRINDALMPGGEPFHIVQTRVPTPLANSLERLTLDGMQAVHVAEGQLDALNAAGRWKIWDWVPWVGKPGAAL